MSCLNFSPPVLSHIRFRLSVYMIGLSNMDSWNGGIAKSGCVVPRGCFLGPVWVNELRSVVVLGESSVWIISHSEEWKFGAEVESAVLVPALGSY